MVPKNKPMWKSLQDVPLPVILVGGALAIILVIAGVLATELLPPRTSSTVTTTPTANPLSGPISPFIFGTNLGLFNEHDQTLYSDDTRHLMKQLHVRMVRMPVRSEDQVPEDVEIQAAQMIKEIGAVPLIALRGSAAPQSVDVLAVDSRVMQDMRKVFGNGTTIYYEFGNEDDFLGGKNSTFYTQKWNEIVPRLKQVDPQAHFIGPVNYQYSPKFLTYFLQHANPRPNEISWHEYTCSYKWTADKCLANIGKWPQHIADARRIMQTILGTTLPIMITEWNYAPDQSIQSNGEPYDDGKWNNTTFMTNWTTKALKTLADNRIFASMQYSVTNTALPLISNDVEATTQGITFGKLYEQLIKS